MPRGELEEISTDCLICQAQLTITTPEDQRRVRCACGLCDEPPLDCGECFIFVEVCGGSDYTLEHLEPGSTAWWERRAELLLADILERGSNTRQEYLAYERRLQGRMSGKKLYRYRWRVLRNLRARE
ncbi:MAG: hypothetical protein AAGF11_26405 [Myxococcota bacterium]